MRVCVGIAPDFWYDMADEYGLLFQNEWLYWQNHGWDEQIRKEYTDWVWTDGSHPSIGIWDAINENWDNYIGNTLIPELKKLDNTRIWDSGYMKSEEMPLDEMDEPHPYQGRIREKGPASKSNFYPLGDLDFKPARIEEIQEASTVQLVNEYGWIWLWRNGKPSKLTTEVYEYYLGKNSTPEQNRELQAYWLELETEWLRSEPSIAGVLAFCFLANNYGYTGDWFQGNIRDLQPTPTLDWFRHAFAPAATYLNLTDERYTKYIDPHQPGSHLLFTLAGINNLSSTVSGKVTIRLYDASGKSSPEQSFPVKLASFQRTDIPAGITLPAEAGGYLLVAEFAPENGAPVLSRRFIRIGQMSTYTYFQMSLSPKK
jgi:beta-galactosidase